MPYFFDPETRTPLARPGRRRAHLLGEQMLDSQVDLAPRSIVPAHAHPHEQFAVLLRGELRITIAGETQQLKVGAIYIVPGGVEHSVVVSEEGAQLIEAFGAPCTRSISSRIEADAGVRGQGSGNRTASLWCAKE